jgi:hypothetical protein
MAITLTAALQPGFIRGCRVVGIMSLKWDHNPARPSLYVPVIQARGPVCERCWMERGFVVPESSATCRHRGAS